MAPQRVLMLQHPSGSGFVTRPTLDVLSDAGIEVSVACRTLESAKKLAEGVKLARPISLDVTDEKALDAEVAKNDLIISLIPYTFHATVIKSAIRQKKHVVTTSYVSPAMLELDQQCKDAGITVMNEIGLDPGIDHLYAIKTISEVHAAGGKIISFLSYCGGLPAPENSDNPLGYKFSWSARGVLLALKNAAKYYKDGKVVEVASQDLMGTAKPYLIYPGYAFVAYPNRDSTPYKERYGIPEAKTIVRGTLRYQGFPEFVRVLVDMGFLSDEKQSFLDQPITWKEATQKILSATSSTENDLKWAIASKAKFDSTEEKDRIIDGLRWIGLFSDEKIIPRGNPLDTLCATLEKKMQFEEGERDFVMLQHKFGIENKDGSKETRTSTLVEYGDPKGYSAMAKLVGIPCGVAVKQVLDGTISEKGILAPMTPKINDPLMEELKKYGITMLEKTFAPAFQLPAERNFSSNARKMSTQKAVGENMLWGGRFTSGLDPLMIKYNNSLPFDRIFWSQDIAGSIAWARANKNNGILTAHEFSEIERGFKQIAEEWKNDIFVVKENDEDIHTANERRLGEVIGKDIGGKLHTGRSRNEQVASDMRMWLRDELRVLEAHLSDLIKVSIARAEKEIDYLMPGYTHLQKAQPVRWSQWLLSHATAFASDLERLREVIKRVNRSPLGCGALAGNSFKIDRVAMAKELGFDGLLFNSMNAVGDRDFVLETLQWGSALMVKISRWAEDLIIYSSLEFSFVRLSDAYSTGSSLMPQKKNADSLELLRGKSGRAFGQMAGLMCTIKGLPTTYNKDLQESVEPMLDHIVTLSDSIQIATGVLSTLTTFPDKMIAALAPEMLATEIADYLVRKGVPFREAHHISGRCVALAEKTGRPMDQLSIEEYNGIDTRLEKDVQSCLDYERAVELKDATGGTSKRAVREQIVVLKGLLDA
ncbi:hypothetical protein B7463_g2784, partial [Scytalidium lignicola]